MPPAFARYKPYLQVILGRQGPYRLIAAFDTPLNRTAVLTSDVGPLASYFIAEFMPATLAGNITRVDSGELVADLSGLAGGEFANSRSAEADPLSPEECAAWAASQFGYPLQSGSSAR